MQVETVGEEYVVTSGCQEPKVLNHIQLCVNMGLAMLTELRQMVNLEDITAATSSAALSSSSSSSSSDGTSGTAMQVAPITLQHESATQKLARLVPGLEARVGVNTGELVAGRQATAQRSTAQHSAAQHSAAQRPRQQIVKCPLFV